MGSSIAELTDFICAAQMAKAADVLLSVEDRKPLCNNPNYKKIQNSGYDFWKRNKQRKLEKKLLNEDDHAVHLSNPMIGFRKYVLDEYRKWNLVWVGRNKVDPLGPDEEEMLLGFPKNHTRGAAKDMFPGGINVLSLFSGINDAEVSFYCLIILLKVDVKELNDDRLEQLMSRFGGFDLVIGGIPLTASSAASRYTPTYPTLPELMKGLVDSKTGYLYFWNHVTNVTPYERSTSVESIPMSYFMPISS
ncbi:hypothetical protein F3Y22_tig00111356pilonHSYRG00015 [Hibiscus syriacus]|uniref:Uncharacterized protein n=1 Tax=Hibiscus syriacus TaxID=106335 RepID=A0A6A2YNM3_HIBSY|nr:hypothetical protein F3Y22_tig00111356pilonHSYRG00015 [Hibiscus syriacus]